jgi:hypothetical protein
MRLCTRTAKGCYAGWRCRGSFERGKGKGVGSCWVTSDWKRPGIGGEVGEVDGEEYERAAMPKLIAAGGNG